VHVVLEEGSRSPAANRVRSHELLVLSARTETALAQLRTRLAAWMERADEVDLADAAYTLQVGRKRFDVRDVVVCESRADAIRQLAGLGAPHKARRNASRRIAFVCARQPRNWSAEAALFDTEPRFRQAIEGACTALARHLGPQHLDASASLWTDGALRARAAERIGQPQLDAVTTVIAQVALGALWASWGIRPDVVVGDGIGELAAACLAGRLALDDALAIIVERSGSAGVLIDGVAPPAPSSTSSQVRVFSAETAGALADEPLIFLELGASSDCTRQLGRAPCLSSLPDDDAAPSAHLMTALGRLWTEGAEVDWEGVQAGRAARRIALPTYPFERKRFWFEPG
ncbi:MAG: acyltransferase domain-containing protein, partial [Kofleriaceae bacterium]